MMCFVAVLAATVLLYREHTQNPHAHRTRRLQETSVLPPIGPPQSKRKQTCVTFTLISRPSTLRGSNPQPQHHPTDRHTLPPSLPPSTPPSIELARDEALHRWPEVQVAGRCKDTQPLRLAGRLRGILQPRDGGLQRYSQPETQEVHVHGGATYLPKCRRHDFFLYFDERRKSEI